MKIPNKFSLLAQAITVSFRPEKFTDADGCYGFACYRRNEVELRPATATMPLSDEQIAQTFWHELTHFVLYHAGAAYSGKSEYMHQDDGFVDLVGSLLHQAVDSFEFDA